MKKVSALLGKELGSFFISPIAYVVMFVFLIISGFLFTRILTFFVIQSIQWMRQPGLADRLNLNDFVLNPFFHNVAVFFIFLVPVVTMRLLSDEKKLGTGELLFTTPITTTEIVIGKYLSALTVLAVMLLGSFMYPLVLLIFGNPDAGPIFSTYLGMFLMGASAVGIGLFASSLTENQVIAALITWGILILLWIIHFGAQAVGPTFGSVLEHLSFLVQWGTLNKGVIELKTVIYFLSIIFLTLFLTQRVLDSQSWR